MKALWKGTTCSASSCDRPATTGGFCGAHYARHKNGADMNKPLRPKTPKNDPYGACSIDGCNRPIKSRGMCTPHYHRTLRGSDLAAPILTRSAPYNGMLCSVPECQYLASDVGFCGSHYKRISYRKNVQGLEPTEFDLTAPIKNKLRYTPGQQCSVNGCTLKPQGNGLCKSHYTRFIKGRDLDTPYRVAANILGPGRWLTPFGYVHIPVSKDTPGAINGNHGGCRMLEHRYILQNYLGRPLLKSETVHHKDGNRQNNELSNLELRSGAHGSGVRVEDGAVAHINYLEQYVGLDLADRAFLERLRNKAKTGLITIERKSVKSSANKKATQ